jgi:hypothetical protein
MEDGSMLCEHTLLTSGDVADAARVYAGWPARQVAEKREAPKYTDAEPGPGFMCPLCRACPRDMTSTACGHVFCKSCVLIQFIFSFRLVC